MGCPATGCTGYELAASITLTGNWSPIGDNTDNFTATFDGNAPSYTIGNLFISASTDYIGLFGVTGTRSVIRNVKLTGVDVTGRDYVGVLAGRNRGRISNCETIGLVKGRLRVGGLTGLSDGAITASASNVTVTSTSAGGYAGGLVGESKAAINDSSASGSVTSTEGYAGGLVGESKAAINDSSASGSVRAPAWVGGLVGSNEASITGSTASGAVTATRTSGSSLAGGLVGQNLAAPIQNSHASGNVTGSQNTVGGLVGSNYDALAWSGSTTPRNTIIGSTARGTVRTTGRNVGGLVGWNNGSISDSAAFNPSVTGALLVGGLVGVNYENQADGSNTIDRSTATASVTGTASVSLNVGGLVGWNNGPVRDSYAGGAVKGVSQKGGLVGINEAGGQVIDSRADGAVGSSTNAGQMTGGLVGLNKGDVAGSVATGTVKGSAASTALGGLVGRNTGSISSSAATGVVSGGSQVGGLVGYATYAGRITESWAGGAVSAISLQDVSTSGTMVGGLVGWNDGPVGASFATGNVTGADVAGGLIGRNIGMLIATHATGNVTVSGSPFCRQGVACPEGVGGLIGYALERTIASTLTTPFTYSTSSVEASYSTGSVSGDSTHILGSLAGNAERDTTTPSDSASFTNSYWDTGTSGQTLGVGSDDEDENGTIDGTETATAGVTGQTTTALKAPTGYTGIFANWNVTIPNVTARTGGPWDFGAATDYPVLRGLSASPSFPAGTATRSVAEERTAGTSIGSPLTATDSDALSYKLVGADAIFFSINSMTGQLLTKTSLDYENPGDANRDNEYEFMIQARDGTTVDFQTVAVTVTDAIENLAAPTITGDATVTVTENSTAVATYQAVDPDGATSTFTWTLGGDDAGAFEISDAGVLTFDPAPDFEAPGDANGNNIYEVTVQANDGGMTGDFDVLVTIEGEDELPQITLASAAVAVTVDGNAVSVDENYDGRLVLVSVNDPDGTHTDYTLTLGGAHGSSFTLSGNQVRFSSPPNYEAGSQYDLTVTAANAQESETIDVTVMVGDVDEPPEITLASAAGVDVTVDESAVSVQENHTADLVEVTATDPEGTHADYTLALGGTDSSSFTLNAGVLRFTNPPDHEAREVYRLRLTASNASETSTLNVTVTVGDVNEPPNITGEAEVTVNEGHTGTLRTYQKSDPDRPSQTTNWGPVGSSEVLSGTHSNTFEFDQTTGRLTFASPPDYENGGGTYQVTLTANDGTLEGSLDITVNVANVEEGGELTFEGGVTQGANGVPLQATLTDPDGVATQTWVWQRRTGTSGSWMDIANTDASSYTPTAADVGEYLRASVTYTDGAGTNDTTLTKATELPTLNDASSNEPPIPPDPLPQVDAIPENTNTRRNVVRVVFTDPESEQLTYLVDSDEFEINSRGQITVKLGAAFDHETKPTLSVTVRAADPIGAAGTATLMIPISDVNERPTAVDLPVTVREDETVDIDVVGRASDQDAGDTLTVADVVRSPRPGGTATVNDGTNDITYRPAFNYHGSDNFTYRVKDANNLRSNIATVTITVEAVNDAPEFPYTTVTLTVSESASESDSVGAPVIATDIDGDTPTYSLLGADASSFEIDAGGQITVGAFATFVAQETYEVTVEADDGSNETNATARIAVTITVVAGPVAPPPTSGGGGGFGGGGGGGGGGGSSGPSPSTLDFEWTVKRDIEDLDSGHDTPTGLWSDGATLWLLENGEGDDDAVYAYDLATGERGEEREFALAETNRAPRGFWSNGETVWVSDSGRERLFAYGLASGEREESREVELAERNRDARGIWSDEETMWVLDGGKDSLFAYDLASGELLAEYALDSTNGDPRGIWSDGVTVWVSNHDPKRLFAYRLPARPEAPAAEDSEPQALERVRDEEFDKLSRASNNSPRGIWSDGDVMYVADESDGKVYTYNLPDAIDARLASLTLSGVDIGEFDPKRTDYEGAVGDGVTETTVTAEALQRRTDVDIDPPDADEEVDGHQVALQGVEEITVTVTSADGSRMKTYRVAFKQAVAEIPLDPGWNTFAWPGADGVAIAETGLPDTVVAVLPLGRGLAELARELPRPGGGTWPQHPHDLLHRRHLLGRSRRGGHLDGSGGRSSLALGRNTGRPVGPLTAPPPTRRWYCLPSSSAHQTGQNREPSS